MQKRILRLSVLILDFLRPLRRLFYPERWTLGIYVGVFLFIVFLSFSGERGLGYWLYLKQKETQLKTEISQIKRDIESYKNEIAQFKNSSEIRERYIREELGLLKENEGSIEFRKNLESNSSDPIAR